VSAVERVREALRAEMAHSGPWPSDWLARAALAAAAPTVEQVARTLAPNLFDEAADMLVAARCEPATSMRARVMGQAEQVVALWGAS